MLENIIVPDYLGFTPTEQQINIVNTCKEYDRVKIEAYAGAAKTSTMALVAANIKGKSLYMAFNKSMVDEAKGRFPDHVEIRTTHSLAYARVGFKYRHKLSRPVGAYKNVLGTGGEIGFALKIKPIQISNGNSLTGSVLGYCVRETVNAFEHSSDEELTIKHVSWRVIPLNQRPLINKDAFNRSVLANAKKLWAKRIDIKDDTLITHDTYLKLYQLTKPNLTKQYDVIYLDEGNDLNPCLLDIIKNQTGGKIFICGDRYQSIYAFRGSVNAMQSVDWKRTELSTSFRFGQEIADLARKVTLDMNSLRPVIDIKGFDQIESKVLRKIPEELKQEPWCILYRTNAALLDDAIQYINEGKTVNIYVDTTDFINKLKSVIALKQQKPKLVKHFEIVGFYDWENFKEEAQISKGELLRMMLIVEQDRHEAILDALANHKPSKNPDIVMVTAHKFKGQEFNNVKLADDFDPLIVIGEGREAVTKFKDETERNLLYVALTRAKNVLVTNEAIARIINLGNRRRK